MAGGGVGFAEIGAMTVGAAASFTVTAAGVMKVFGAKDLTMRASATAAGSMVVKDSAVVADFMARAMVADTAGTDSYPRSGKLEDGWQQKCQPFSFLERISQKELSGEKLCDDAFVCGRWEVLKDQKEYGVAAYFWQCSKRSRPRRRWGCGPPYLLPARSQIKNLR